MGSVQLFHWTSLTVKNPLGNSAAKELLSFQFLQFLELILEEPTFPLNPAK
jgi:hypothetical protein